MKLMMLPLQNYSKAIMFEVQHEVVVKTGRSLRTKIKGKFPKVDLRFLSSPLGVVLPSERNAAT